ncbi:hypothetical protein L1D14_06605 [Vibrio tubiashii]|uniref:hypothetical protein n=1 Tax=Vibrio tubiashii TaxID=29498 RepID=UPI001EFDCF4E|nr:hypothetical protein [Vibrio tubiashii]MCG9575911.1 hypothetical protein [Vibrio tubiashii]
MENNEQSIKAHYDGSGEKIKQHLMIASHVTGSMNGLEVMYKEAYKEANRIYNSKLSTEVYVEGGIQPGSLWWLLKLFTSESESQQTLERKSIHKAIGKALNRVFNILKNLNLATTEIVIKQENEGYTIDIDGERVVLDELECAILTNPKIRKAISQVASPLVEEGVDSLTISHGIKDLQPICVSSEEKDKLIIKRNHKHIVGEGKIAGFYYVDTLSYNPKKNWTLIDKDNPSKSITVKIVDPTFLKRVSDSKEKFAKDDLLEIEGVWYKEKTRLTGNVSVNYTVTLVKHHSPAEDKQWTLI